MHVVHNGNFLIDRWIQLLKGIKSLHKIDMIRRMYIQKIMILANQVTVAKNYKNCCSISEHEKKHLIRTHTLTRYFDKILNFLVDNGKLPS